MYCQVICSSNGLTFIHPSSHLPIYLTMCPSSHLPIHLPICPFIHPSIYPFVIHQSIHSFIHPSIHPSIYMCIYPSIHLYSSILVIYTLNLQVNHFIHSVTNPILLFGVAFCVLAYWFISIKNKGNNITTLGRHVYITY